MGHRSLFQRIVIAPALALVAMTMLTAGGRAHAELRSERPAAGSVVGGSITTVDVSFIFMEEGGAHVLTLRGPDGEIVAPTQSLTQLSETHLQITVPELRVAGRYDVSYLVEGADGDFTPGAYFFTWDPGAAEAPPFVDFNPFAQTSGDGGGGSLSGSTQAVIVGGAVVATLAGLMVARRLLVARSAAG